MSSETRSGAEDAATEEDDDAYEDHPYGDRPATAPAPRGSASKSRDLESLGDPAARRARYALPASAHACMPPAWALDHPKAEERGEEEQQE